MLERMTDLPMEAIGIDDAPESPAMGFADWVDLGRACIYGPGEDGVGIGDGEDEADRAST